MTPSDGLGRRSNMRLLQFKDDTPYAQGFKNSGPKNLGKGRALQRSCARWKSRTPILPRACVAARLKGRQRRALARGAHLAAYLRECALAEALGDDGSGARAKLEEAARWQALARVAQNELGAWCRSPAINFVAGRRLLDSLAFTGGFDIANPRPQRR